MSHRISAGFIGDPQSNAISMLWAEFAKSQPPLTTREAATAIRFAKYLLDHPEELKFAQEIAVLAEQARPK